MLAQTHTTAQIARMLRASPRSVRRWKNEGGEPKSARHSARLENSYRVEVRSVRAEQRRDKAKHRSTIAPGKLPPVRASRRALKERRIDRRTGQAKETGREYESSWINYDVRGWTVREIHGLLVTIWKQGGNRDFQLVFQIPAGGTAVDSGGKKSGNVVARSTRSGSAPLALSRAGTGPIPSRVIESEAELLNLLLRFVDMEQGPKSPRMLYVAVNDLNERKVRRYVNTKPQAVKSVRRKHK